MSRIGARIAKIEQTFGRGDEPRHKVHLFPAETDEQEQETIAAMIADGRADGPDDLFVIIRKFSEPGLDGRAVH